MNQRRVILISVIILIAGAIIYLQSLRPRQSPGASQVINTPGVTQSADQKAKLYPKAKELVNPDGYVNTPPFKLSDLIGKKVILLDFWTYSCINCQRTIPYLNAWYQKYRNQGLVIVGVHTPEFDFEKNLANVQAAVKNYGIKYPVVQDNEYATWNAYGNSYWPREYLIDIDGYVVHDHIGEGGYDATEQEIQKLLAERMAALQIKNSVADKVTAPADAISFDPSQVGSPETYFGAARNSYLENGATQTPGNQNLNAPSDPNQIIANALFLGGLWNFQNEYGQNLEANAQILYKFQAKNVYLVGSADKPVNLQIYEDGVLAKTLTVQTDGLYQLISNPGYGEHLLKILIQEPGLRAYTLTFG